MLENTLWHKASQTKILTAPHIITGFDIGFDSKIPEEAKDALMHFVYWVEDHFHLPVTLWVDFKYNHYLIGKNGQRVGYRFYWADFANYPVFDNPDDIPVIELAARTGHSTIEEILRSFTEAISLYYTWLTNAITNDSTPDRREVEKILEAYLSEQVLP